MSYADLSEKELREVADMYAVDVDEDDTEQTLVNKVSTLNVAEVLLDFPQLADKLALPAEEDDDEDEGTYEDPEEEEETPALITSDNTTAKGRPAKKTAKKTAAKTAAKKTAAAPKVAAKTVVPDEKTLVKMTRNNPVYEVRGYRFTRTMPYVYVKNADIDYLIEVEGGFTIAKPDEVKAFFN